MTYITYFHSPTYWPIGWVYLDFKPGPSLNQSFLEGKHSLEVFPISFGKNKYVFPMGGFTRKLGLALTKSSNRSSLAPDSRIH